MKPRVPAYRLLFRTFCLGACLQQQGSASESPSTNMCVFRCMDVYSPRLASEARNRQEERNTADKQKRVRHTRKHNRQTPCCASSRQREREREEHCHACFLELGKPVRSALLVKKVGSSNMAVLTYVQEGRKEGRRNLSAASNSRSSAVCFAFMHSQYAYVCRSRT